MPRYAMNLIVAVSILIGVFFYPHVLRICSAHARSAGFVQVGNTISGYVFGPQRQPLSEITVELLDDLSRNLGRTRTNASGRYVFNRVPSGRFKVRVLPLGTDYSGQEQEVEIQNIQREIGGVMVPTAIENAQRDFYLRTRRTGGAETRADIVFAQDVPAAAKELYVKGVESLANKNEAEGLKSIKSAIEKFPDYYEAIEKLGVEYIRLRHFEAAEILFLRGTQINPRSYRSWYGLAYAQHSQNKLAPASEAIAKAVALNSSSAEAFLLDGVLRRKMGDFAEAEKRLKRARSLGSGPLPEIHWQLALLYGNGMKRYADAATELERLLELVPQSKEAENIKKLIKQFREKASETKS